MDERLRARRRSVQRARGSRRASLVFLAVLVVAGAALFLWLRASDVFAVRTITATATRYVTTSEIAQAVSFARGTNLLALSTRRVEEALEALPYVAEAQVHRLFPDRLEVRLVERRPLARLDLGHHGLWLVAEEGVLLGELAQLSGALLATAADLPLIEGERLSDPQPGDMVPRPVAAALTVARWFERARGGQSGSFPGPGLQRISVHTGGELVVQLEGEVEVLLGRPEDLEQKLTVATAIVERYLREGKRLRYVDARVAARVAVKAE